MIDLASLTNVLQDAVKPIFSIDANTTAFYADDGRRPFINPMLARACFWKVFNFQHVGQDHKSFAVDGTTNDLIPTVAFQAQVRMQLRVEAYDQRPNNLASYHASRVAARLKLPAILASLKAAGFALQNVGPVQALSIPVDDRLFSLAVIEATFNAVNTETDTNEDNQIGTVESVEITGNAPSSVPTFTVTKP